MRCTASAIPRRADQWDYRYYKGSRDSTKMFELLPKLSAAIQTKQQFEERGEASRRLLPLWMRMSRTWNCKPVFGKECV